MSILVGKHTKLCVSGITGREGKFHTLRNRDYGTQVATRVARDLVIPLHRPGGQARVR